MSSSTSVLVLGMLGSMLPASMALAQGATPDTDPVLATVNGEPIRRSDLEFLCLVRNIPEERRQAAIRTLVDELIDQRLIAEFLKSRRTEASPEELAGRVEDVRRMIAASQRDPDEVLKKLGVTEAMLERALALPLAWKQHVRRVATDEQVRTRFETERARYDGTRLRVSQIVRRIPAGASDADVEAALALLAEVREAVSRGELTFAEAAREHSQSPTAESGGDLGWMTYGTRLPRELSQPAFRLQRGEVSAPIRTRFGVHLLTVTDAQPGDLSLEDVRSELLADIGQGLWDEQLAASRAAAKIEYRLEPQR